MNHKFSTFLLLGFLLLISNQYLAQPLGNNPNGQNWQSLQTDFGQLIFPFSFQKQAIETAQLLNSLENNNPIGLRGKKRQLRLILQNQTLNANGFVALAPFRSEFYGTPPQSLNDLSTVNWLDLLSIHEFRHIEQYRAARKGVTNIGYYLTGEYGWSFMQRLSIPNWFFEGDAVLAETALTTSGRGRLPAFTAEQRSIAFSPMNYSYHQIRNGSFKNLIPDHYRWGYLMMAKLTEEKGYEVIQPLVEDAAAYKSIFYPFSKALKKQSGYTTKSLYQKSWNTAVEDWKAGIAELQATKSRNLTDSTLKTPTFYHFPQYESDSSILVLSNSYKRTDEILRIKDSKKEVVCRPGLSNDPFFHYSYGHLVWTEFRNHPRRTNAEFEDIFVYDVAKGEKIRLSRKTRYFSPVLNSNASKVYAIKVDLTQKCILQSIDVKKQTKDEIFAFPAGAYISRLNISENDSILVYIKRKNNQAALFSLDLENLNEKQLCPWSAHAIGAPRIVEDFVYYSASYNQRDNIYRVSLNGNLQVEQLTEAKIGFYQPAVNPSNKELLFSETIFNGHSISKLEEANWVKNEIQMIEPIKQKWNYSHLNKAPHFAEQATTDSLNQNESKKYNNLFRGFRLHSWPITASPAAQEMNLVFNNYLNDWSASVGGGYNYNEKGSFYQARLSYGKFLPILSASINSNYRNLSSIWNDLYLESTIFRSNAVSLGAAIPLNWTLGNYRLSLNPQLRLQYLQLSGNEAQPNENYQFAHTGLSFSYLRRRARQNLAPRFGLSASINYSRNAVKLSEERFQAESRLYLPGLFANHSLQLSGGFRRELQENFYQHTDFFNYARGFEAPYNDEYQRLSIDYSLPLLYPDWGFWGINYFKRLRANFFFDYGKQFLYAFDYNYEFQSTGVELFIDNVLMNTFPISLGFRTSYLINEDPSSPDEEITYGIIISSGF